MLRTIFAIVFGYSLWTANHIYGIAGGFAAVRKLNDRWHHEY